MFLKGHYPHNFERAAKSVTCVQIESIQIDGFKNVKKKKKSKWYPVAMETNHYPRSKKCLHVGQNISSLRNSAKLNF